MAPKSCFTAASTVGEKRATRCLNLLPPASRAPQRTLSKGNNQKGGLRFTRCEKLPSVPCRPSFDGAASVACGRCRSISA